MSEIKRVATPMANTMMVLDEGEEVQRSPSGLSKRPLKKATSEGLISLSAEPGNVKFEIGNQKWLESEGTRCSSAGRIERKLQLFKKKEDTGDQRRNSTDGIFYKPQPDNPLVTKISAMKIGTTTTTAKTKLLQDEKPSKTTEPESESSESESDESESDNEETKGNAMSNEENKVMAPIEVKAEFIQCVMSGNYTKAQEICKQILLLEPDNATCKEFHSVIVMKIEQEKMEDSDKDDTDDDEEDDEEDNDDDEEDEDDDDEEDSNTSSSSEESEEDTDDEEFTVAPGLNLLMGGLPIKPQTK